MMVTKVINSKTMKYYRWNPQTTIVKTEIIVIIEIQMFKIHKIIFFNWKKKFELKLI